MANPGALFGGYIGPDPLLYMQAGNYSLASANACIAWRFMAKQTLDIYSVRLYWNANSSAPAMTLGIQTITTSTGKPSGSLYDANATITFTPTQTGVVTYTFSTPPSTGLTVGTEYAVVLTTGAASGTTSNICGWVNPSQYPLLSRYPHVTLYGASFAALAESQNRSGVLSLVLSDGTEEVASFVPYGAYSASAIYGTTIAAQKITFLTSVSIAGIQAQMNKNGTPAGDLNASIYAAGSNTLGSQVSGTSVTANHTSLGGLGAGSLSSARFNFPAPVTLTAGTYYIVFASSGSANSSNCWQLYSGAFLNSACVGSERLSTSTNSGTAMSDSTTAVAAVWLIQNVDVAASGGSGLGVLGGPMQVSMG